jgi:hypothetical protein
MEDAFILVAKAVDLLAISAALAGTSAALLAMQANARGA